MARPSSRLTLLETALELLEESGLQGLTYESLSARSGMSRSGILYHFPSKEEMIAAARQYTVEQWNIAAEAYLDVPFEEAAPSQRAIAYILATAKDEHTAEGHNAYQDATHSEFAEAIWREVRARWIDFTEGVLSPAQHMAVLAADGLWLDHGPHRMLPDSTRDRVIDELLNRATPESTA